jgi:radical SAM protein with 4Fe4S-binding SPASM domain
VYFRRLLNFFKLLISYRISRMTGNVIHWGRPVSISIEPTNYCNLHCPECPSGQRLLTRERGFIPPETFKKIIDQLSPELHWLTFYFQGEPYLHPGFYEMVRYAKSKNIRVSTSTNGHFLDASNAAATIRSGIDRLIISLDGADPKAYSAYRIGGSYVKVIQGIKEIVRQKNELGSGKPSVVLQFLVLKSNQHQIRDIKELGTELGVSRVELKSAQFYDFEQGNPLMTDISRYSRYEKCTERSPDGALFKIKNRLPRHCFRMWSSTVFTWDGWVVPCCYDKDAAFKMGNIREKPFNDIWNSKIYDNFRNKIIHTRQEIDICKNCAEGLV